ncbi:MAG: hypothetical protein AAB116_20855 [Candidatus Poribacteria bacterium]
MEVNVTYFEKEGEVNTEETIKPAYSTNFFSLRVLEIITKPRVPSELAIE